jgi:hypothetical protein
MPVLTQGPTLGDLVKWECYGAYNRETVTLLAGTVYPLGAVLGKITTSGKYRLAPAAEVEGSEGAETAAALLLEAVDATGADQVAVVLARGPALVARDLLAFDASVDQPAAKATKEAELVALGIVPRTTV